MKQVILPESNSSDGAGYDSKRLSIHSDRTQFDRSPIQNELLGKNEITLKVIEQNLAESPHLFSDSPSEEGSTESAPGLKRTAVKKPNKKKGKGPRHISFLHQCWYQIFRLMFQILFLTLLRTRHYGRRNVPKRGPVLMVSNHQSFLDPPAIGCGIFRRMNYLARKTLFKFKPFGWFIDSVDAIPLNQEGLGYEGIKETLRRLKNNEMVLIFPEGSRTWDGEIMPFRSGYITLALRSKATIVPTAIAGAFEVWPRTKKIPSFFKRGLRIEYGTPIPYEEAVTMSEEDLHDLVERRVRELYEKLRRH